MRDWLVLGLPWPSWRSQTGTSRPSESSREGRRGIDSRRAVTLLTEQCGLERVFDIAGGLQAWTATVAPDFPRY